MSFEPWPSPDSRRGPLPRIEDLPIREQGYDQEAVRRAFDGFYRHAAQLDASLNALEAVAAFQRDAAQLRADLRALQNLGLGGGEPSWASSSWAGERAPSDVPVTAVRIAGEAGLLIAVAVVAGVANLAAWAIVALMGAALAVVWLSEWLAARARTRVPASAYEHVAFSGYGSASAEAAGEPAPYVEAPALDPGVGWSAFEAAPDEIEPPEETEADAAAEVPAGEETGAPLASREVEPDVDEPAGAPVAAEQGERTERADQADQADRPDRETKPARGWLRRRRGKNGTPAETAEPVEDEPQPSHVRVLTPADDAPWERGFDGEPPADED